MRFPMGSKRLEDRVKRTTLLLSPVGFSAFGGNIKGDEAEVSRGRENLINEIEGLSNEMVPPLNANRVV